MEEKNSTEIANRSEIRTAIENFGSQKQFKQLVSYGIIRLNLKFGIKYNVDTGFGPVTLEDVIQNVFSSFLSEGGRNWYKNKYPKFRDQFYSAYDSEIANTVKTYLEKSNQCFTIREDDCVIEQNIYDYKQLLTVIESRLATLGATKKEIKIFEPYMVHGMSRKVIAETMDVSPETITNWQKKLKRKIVEIIKYWKPL